MKTNNRPPRGRALFPLAAAALLALASHASASPRFVLRIADHDGTALIAGDSSDPHHQDWIDVHAFGTSAELIQSEDGSVRRGTCAQTDFTFHKSVGKSTPLLQEACFTGLLLPAVQVKYLGSDGTPSSGAEPIVVELRHVQIVGYRMFGNSDSRMREEVALNFSEVEYTYRQRNEAGEVVDETNAILTAFLGTEDPAFDDDHDGIPNDLDSDDDNDGVADRDEIAGGSNPFRDDADEDLDGDGQSNRSEAIAGSRMDDPADFFGIERIARRRTPEGLQVTVAFPVKGGRHYRLLASMDPRLPRDAWMVLDEFDLPPGSPETGADIELNPAILRNAAQLFFQVDVSLLDEPALPDPVEPIPVDPKPIDPNPIDPIDPIQLPGPDQIEPRVF